jgi:hypothetical protein
LRWGLRASGLYFVIFSCVFWVDYFMFSESSIHIFDCFS